MNFRCGEKTQTKKKKKERSDKIWTRTASNRDKVREENHRGSKPLDLDISSRRKTIASVVRERDA